MSYKSLKNLSDDMETAALQASGLNSFHFLEGLSEVNRINSPSEPMCVVLLPNSVIPNINRAREEYEIESYILVSRAFFAKTPNITIVESQYDLTMELFTNWVSNLMKQRDGAYTVDRESFEIDRVRNIGSSEFMGVNVRFTLLAPSQLLFYSESVSNPTFTLTNTSNLYGFWRADQNVSVTTNSILWGTSVSDGTGNKTFTHSNSSYIPNWTGNTIDLENETFASNVEGLKLLSDLDFPSANFSIYIKLTIPSNSTGDHNHLFRMRDPSNENGFVFGINSHGSNSDLDGVAFYKIDGDSDNVQDEVQTANRNTFTNSDLEPINSAITIAVINDSSANKVTLIHGANYYQVTGALNVALQNVDMLIGHDKLDEWNFNFKAFKGSIHAIAIYKEAHSLTNAATVTGNLNTL